MDNDQKLAVVKLLGREKELVDYLAPVIEDRETFMARILAEHVIQSITLSPVIAVELELCRLAIEHGFDYHHMLLGLHGDCDEEDVMKAISDRNKLIRLLFRYKNNDLTIVEHTKALNSACANACYEYARYVSDKMAQENNTQQGE